MAEGSGGAFPKPRKRKAREFPRGRQLDGTALMQVQALLGSEQPVRDRL